jgi:hypothetical protein
MIKLLEILSKVKNNIFESFILDDLSTEEQINLYNLYKNSYEKSVGIAWDENKFFDRAEDWEFFGDQNGYVAVRLQQSGIYKLAVVGGSTKSILKGIQELTSTNKPIWGMVSKDILNIMKKMNFTSPSSTTMKILLKVIPKSVFGGVDFKVNSDGSITFNYEDTGSAQKYFVGNKQYFTWLKSNLNPLKSSLLSKNLTEAKQVGDLYHFTSINSVPEILKTRVLIPNEEGAVSTTIRPNMTTAGFHTLKNNIARLMLDGNKISTKYKIQPFSYETEDLGEEQIIINGEYFPYLPYLKRIDLFVNKPNDPKLEKLKELLTQTNIPYKVYEGSPIKNIPYKQPKTGDPRNINIDTIPHKIKIDADQLFFPKTPTSRLKYIRQINNNQPFIYNPVYTLKEYPNEYAVAIKGPISNLNNITIEWDEEDQNNNYKVYTAQLKNLKQIDIPMYNNKEWRNQFKYTELKKFNNDVYNTYLLIPKSDNPEIERALLSRSKVMKSYAM